MKRSNGRNGQMISTQRAFSQFIKSGGFWRKQAPPIDLTMAESNGLVGPWGASQAHGRKVLAALTARHYRVADFCIRMGELLEKMTLSHCFLKGQVTARHWKHASYRPQSDIDLLVDVSDAARTMEVLVSAGLVRAARPLSSSHFHTTLETPLGPLELHTSLGHDFPFRVSTNALLSRSILIDTSQGKLKALDPVDELVHLLVHAATHGPGRLLWLFDLREVALSRADWPAVAARAKEMQVLWPAWWAAALARHWVGAQIPVEAFECLLGPSRVRRAVASTAVEFEFSKRGEGGGMRFMRLLLTEQSLLQAAVAGANRWWTRHSLSKYFTRK
jgi:hypothetical protein